MKKSRCKESIKDNQRGCHSRMFLSGIATALKTQGGDPRLQASGMTGNGFTLIELLVVVLIIGILAAIAVPQYQKAVVKARFAEAITTLKAIKQAKDLCALREGRVCTLVSRLDLELSGLRKYGDFGWRSNYFWYQTDDGWNGLYGPTASYLQEEVCLCYYDEEDPGRGTKGSKLVLSQNQGQCGTPAPRYDYSALLGIPEVDGDTCGCC